MNKRNWVQVKMELTDIAVFQI